MREVLVVEHVINFCRSGCSPHRLQSRQVVIPVTFTAASDLDSDSLTLQRLSCRSHAISSPRSSSAHRQNMPAISAAAFAGRAVAAATPFATILTPRLVRGMPLAGVPRPDRPKPELSHQPSDASTTDRDPLPQQRDLKPAAAVNGMTGEDPIEPLQKVEFPAHSGRGR